VAWGDIVEILQEDFSKLKENRLEEFEQFETRSKGIGFIGKDVNL